MIRGYALPPPIISFGRSAVGDLFQFVVIDRLRFLGHAVGNDLVSLARKIQMDARA